MGQGVKKERGSCLHKEHNQCILIDRMCDACYELLCYPYATAKLHELKTTGVCFCLHPETKENWKPFNKMEKF